MTSMPKLLRVLIAVVVVLLIVLVVRKKHPAPPIPGAPPISGTPAIDAATPECPVDSVRLINADSHQGTTLAALTLSKFQTTVPEFNDCQQLLTGAAASYGPLVGVFAADSLNAVIDTIYRLAGLGIAVRALSIAELVDWGPGGYPQLGISRQGDGINCLYMWASIDGTDTLRHAFMLPVTAEPDCQQRVNPQPLPPGATALKVDFDAVNAMYGPGDYPEAARWDWDPRAKQQYIGIGCITGWCEIGGKGSPRYDDISANSQAKKLRRLFQVKGWYDEERLAVTNVGGGLAPSDVVGTIIPSEKLVDIKDDMANFASQWPVVARIALTGPLDAYQVKLNVVGGDVSKHIFNAIALCMGDRNDCNIPADVTDACHTLDLDPDPHHKWWATVRSQASRPTTEYRCVVRRTHPGVTIPAMVRWRWKLSDQTAWIPCPRGCCEVTDEK